MSTYEQPASPVEDKIEISSKDEKHLETVTVESIDSKDVDAALALVGQTRTMEFSEEYNLRLRRKLVCEAFLALRGWLS